MIWSISSFKVFQQCRRKWYYDEKFASRSVKDESRLEAYWLSQLSSIDAWRGLIVDYVISEEIIPCIEKRHMINKEKIIESARKTTRARYNFAKQKSYREKGLKKGDHKNDYAALYPFEYGNHTEVELNVKFSKAWEDIEMALINFLNQKDLLQELKTATRLITQRALQYDFHGFTIKGFPDLIAFFSDKPPHIFDWKVHFEGTKNYNDQLNLYAMALYKIVPHADFPTDYDRYSLFDYNLTEVQLLKNYVRNYKITTEDVERLNDEVADAVLQMECAQCHLPLKNLDIEDFERTNDPINCKFCPFKKICFQ